MAKLTTAEIIEIIERSGREGRQYLEDIEAPDKIAALCDALGKASSAHVRHVICNILASLGDASALECLSKALEDPVPEVAAAAADAVGNCAFGASVVDDLRIRLGDKLLELLKGSSALNVRASSVYALGLLSFRPAASRLMEILDDEAPMLRWCAAEALAHIGGQATSRALRRREIMETDQRVLDCIRKAVETLAERSRT